MLVLVGTVIGGGFASGREIGTYFLKNGESALWSMVVFGAVFFVICLKVCLICKKENITTVDKFFKTVFGNNKGKVVYFFVALFSFMVLCSMLSAMAELGAYYWNEGKLFLRIVFSLMLCVVLSKGFGGVEYVNRCLVPVLVVGIAVLGVMSDGKIKPVFCSGKIILPFVSSIIYTCYNMITVIPALVELSCGKSKRENAVSCFLSSVVLFGCAWCIGNIISAGFEENMLFSIPVIRAVAGDDRLMIITTTVVLFSMATTVVSSACWVKDYIYEKTGDNHYVFLSVLALGMSFFPFSVFVDRMYFVFSALALLVMGRILIY